MPPTAKALAARNGQHRRDIEADQGDQVRACVADNQRMCDALG